MSLIRINKYLSICGITSRRGADALIGEKRVTINDRTLEERGAIVDTDNDIVKVDGVEALPVEESVYVLLNKPTNTMTTLHDPFKRRTVVDYLKTLKYRVYPVGRLDFDAEGVLLLTNDGDLAYRLAHPRYRVSKIYEATVEGRFVRAKSDQIKRGIKLDDGAIGRAKVSILSYTGQQSKIRLTLTEGRKREVKQLCQKVGHPVAKLRRVEFAGIRLKNLKPGQFRNLTKAEVNRLRQLVGLI
ncbi:MAG: rRNA pseudouridine synthase [candidate division Zixibacteria bacterium]|nr:rRNA pseudouridine synthase [candidate division Zixibacteria bacterium]